jgi:hypothetical protein
MILSETKYETLKSNWSVEFFDLSYDNAFAKLVALETLKDNDDKVYYIINKKHLWTKNQDERLDDVKINDEEKENRLF